MPIDLLAEDRKKPRDLLANPNSTKALVASLGADDPEAAQLAASQPQTPEPRRNPLQRLRSGAIDALEQVSEDRSFPGLAGALTRFAGGTGKAVIENPVDALGLTEPQKSVGSLREANEALAAGQFKKAGEKGIEGLTSGLASALIVAPGANVARTGATQATKQATRQSGSEFVRRAAEQGIDPTLAARFPRTAGGLSKAVADNPITAGAVEPSARRISAQSEAAVSRAARQFGSEGSVNQAGRVALDAADRFATKRTGSLGPGATFRDKSDVLFNRATSKVNMGAVADLRRTRQVTKEIKSSISSSALAKAESNPQVVLIDDIIRETDAALSRPVPLTRADELLAEADLIRKQTRPQTGQSLAEFVRRSGGIKDDRGDVLSALGGRKQARPGLINQASGQSLDDLALAAQDAGFFPSSNQRLELNDFIDALSEDIAGRRVLTESGERAALDAKAISAAESEFSRLGVNISAPRKQLIRDIEDATGERISAGVSQSGVRPLSISDLRRLRTRIRRAQDQNRFDRAIDDAELARLEGALTEDIYTNIAANGGRRALRDAQRADRFYRRGKQNIGAALQPFLRKGQTEEGAFKAIITASRRAKDGGDIRRIRTLRTALKPDEMQDVASGVVSNLGKPRGGGEFSVETFAREFRALDPQAKNLLFGGNRPALNNLERLAKAIEPQAAVEALTNRSRTGAVLSTGAAAGFASVNLLGAISTVAGAAGMGRLLMSPTFTKAVLSTPSARGFASEAAGAIATAERARVLAILAAVEQSDDEAADIAREIREQLEQAQ